LKNKYDISKTLILMNIEFCSSINNNTFNRSNVRSYSEFIMKDQRNSIAKYYTLNQNYAEINLSTSIFSLVENFLQNNFSYEYHYSIFLPIFFTFTHNMINKYFSKVHFDLIHL